MLDQAKIEKTKVYRDEILKLQAEENRLDHEMFAVLDVEYMSYTEAEEWLDSGLIPMSFLRFRLAEIMIRGGDEHPLSDRSDSTELA